MSQFCGVCLSPNIYHETKLGINVCTECGAHETRAGWQKRIQDADCKAVNIPAVKQSHEEVRSDGTKAVNASIFEWVDKRDT